MKVHHTWDSMLRPALQNLKVAVLEAGCDLNIVALLRCLGDSMIATVMVVGHGTAEVREIITVRGIDGKGSCRVGCNDERERE